MCTGRLPPEIRRRSPDPGNGPRRPEGGNAAPTPAHFFGAEEAPDTQKRLLPKAQEAGHPLRLQQCCSSRLVLVVVPGRYAAHATYISAFSGAADRLPVSFAQVVDGGIKLPLAAAGVEPSHAEPIRALPVLHPTEHRLHQSAPATVDGATALGAPEVSNTSSTKSAHSPLGFVHQKVRAASRLRVRRTIFRRYYW